MDKFIFIQTIVNQDRTYFIRFAEKTHYVVTYKCFFVFALLKKIDYKKWIKL